MTWSSLSPLAVPMPVTLSSSITKIAFGKTGGLLLEVEGILQEVEDCDVPFAADISAYIEKASWHDSYKVTKKCFRQKFWNFIKKLFSIEKLL